MAKSGMSESEVEGDGDGNRTKRKIVDRPKEICQSQENSVAVISTPIRVSTPASILIESLVKNLCVAYEPNTEKSARMYKFICDKLYSMNMIDESYQMNEFESIRGQYQNAFFRLLSSARGDQKAVQPVWPHQDITTSHYHREFEEVEFIAGGGFGQVFKVRHKLDGTEYAIKKIPIRSEGLDSVKNYLSEVKTFACVNHPNIVQYKAAWLDLGAPNSTHRSIVTEYDSEDFEADSIRTKSRFKEHFSGHEEEYIYHKDITDSFSEKMLIDDSSSDFEVDFEHSINSLSSSHSGTLGRKKAREKRNSISEGGKAICKLDFKEINKIRLEQKLSVKWATLYIQMALCQSTLKQWLEKRNNEDIPDVLPPSVKNDTVKEILKQLLKGLQYIHSKGIVHHDIKPSNIFIQIENGKLLVQLGDFGLACPLQCVRHSLALGTRLYAAPEQLHGECNRKSDMYSLGIVLFELVERFRTDMERVQCITELHKGITPLNFALQHPDFAEIITQLVCKDPERRPDATSLLKTLNQLKTNNFDAQIQELKDQLAEKDEEILRLKEQLRLAGVKTL